MSPGVRNPRELEVWRVRDLRDLELRRSEGAAADERPAPTRTTSFRSRLAHLRWPSTVMRHGRRRSCCRRWSA